MQVTASKLSSFVQGVAYLLFKLIVGTPTFPQQQLPFFKLKAKKKLIMMKFVKFFFWHHPEPEIKRDLSTTSLIHPIV